MNKTDVLDHLNYINSHNGMPKDAIVEINSLVERIYSDNDFTVACEAIVARIFENDNCEDRINELSKQYDVYPNMLKLVICQLCSIEKKRICEQAGLSEEHFLEQMLDMAVWTKTNYELNGKWGLAEYGWNLSTIRGGITRLGRLQCENPHVIKADMGITLGGIEIKAGMTAVGIHIPEGDSLTREKRLDSYKRIYEYHKLQGPCIFECESWLFHPLNEQMLPATSNILDFMRDFYIVEFAETGTGDMWRVFGRHWQTAKNNYDLLPRDTGLRRAYADLLKSGKKPAAGHGVFIYDGENFYNK
ncbi:MAG: hypothetical protein E7312_03390 [Clostridiales bacterium]|nr:hypothetical protein [Clostridiales bacterium]